MKGLINPQNGQTHRLRTAALNETLSNLPRCPSGHTEGKRKQISFPESHSPSIQFTLHPAGNLALFLGISNSPPQALKGQWIFASSRGRLVPALSHLFLDFSVQQCPESHPSCFVNHPSLSSQLKSSVPPTPNHLNFIKLHSLPNSPHVFS
jgi:hypothetical protein